MTPLSHFDFYVVVFTDGDIDIQDIKKDCHVNNWSPVLILRTNEGIVVPLFRDSGICINFIKRNVPKNQMVGIMGMNEMDTQLFTDKGWKIDWHTYPKLYLNRQGYEIDVEAIETDFDFKVAKR